MSIRRMPYGSTIPFSNHLVASSVTDSTQSSGDSENTGGGDSSTPQTFYELIDPYLTQDNANFLEQSGDTPSVNASEFDIGWHLFDGNGNTVWKIYDGNTNNGYGTLVYDLQVERTITYASFENLNSQVNSDTIELYVSNDSSVPTSTSTRIINLSSQYNVLRTGMVPVSTSVSGRYVRLKVSHPYGAFLSTYKVYGLASMKLYGTPFLANDLISPNPLESDDGNTTVSGNAPAPNGGSTSHTDGWHVFDGYKIWDNAVTSGGYPDSQGFLGNASTSWLKYDFGSAKTVSLMKFWNFDQTTSGGVYTKGTDVVTISGSNDNITFTDLVTDTGKGSTQNWITAIPSPTAYRYYKITITNPTSSTETVCGLIELEIYGG